MIPGFFCPFSKEGRRLLSINLKFYTDINLIKDIPEKVIGDFAFIFPESGILRD
jgi:hypothetical protein